MENCKKSLQRVYKEMHFIRIVNSAPEPEVIKLFPSLTQMSTKFILLINVEVPTLVGILTCISMMGTTSKRPKARNLFICLYFSFYEQLKFRAQLSRAWKKSFITSGPDLWSMYRVSQNT